MGVQKLFLPTAFLLWSACVIAQDQNMPTTVVKAEYSGAQRSQIESLVKEYSERIVKDPENLKSYETRAMLNLALQEYDLASTDYDFLISKNLNNASWYYFRGVCKLSLNEMDGACADLKKAKEMNYDFNSSELLMFCDH